ncbi:DoxX family protein [Gordonia sp. (in: high G+C Gram-positive bacteria)]|uniref:DoxX family protein n=1 Tax=Gordonia sp. (in: high G+C Gram-positive bacteria) TaxID=84139 RepID=UPI0016AB0272|nr:DoxX family protein [Gordonia sp. (in: high G+C Gram-positive bacteria)]NLG48269.1 DoxX family protein [Gordonia sp. (in: high G+C Gram-positive bacteria)]
MDNFKLGQSLAVTAGRVILGIIFLAHGAQKFFVNGMDATQAGFEAMGAPVPSLSAWVAALAELIGGGMLIIGLLTPVVAAVLIVDMIGAIFIAHIDAGFWVADGGYELVLALIAGLLAVGFVRQGPLAVDTYLFKAAAQSAAVKNRAAADA